MHRIAVIGGDGVGPEVIRETLKLASQLKKKHKLELEWDEFPYGADYYLSSGITIPPSVFTDWPRKYSAVLLGALGDPRVPSNIHAEEILMGLRHKLDLYINFRPVKLINEKICPLKHISHRDQVHFVVFRENTEDIYAGSGGNLKKNTPHEVAMENCIYTRGSVERIIRAAFEYARDNRLPIVLMSDKRNAMKYVGDLWQRTFQKIAEEYSGIKMEHMFIDALCMEVIRNPSRLHVVVTSNMFGDILTDVAAQVQGGMGVAPSVNYNPGHEIFLGVFEPVHGSAPDIAGQGKANPVAAILCLHLLLQRLGYEQAAACLLYAVEESIKKHIVTPDLGGNSTTSQVGDFIYKQINTR